MAGACEITGKPLPNGCGFNQARNKALARVGVKTQSIVETGVPSAIEVAYRDRFSEFDDQINVAQKRTCPNCPYKDKC